MTEQYETINNILERYTAAILFVPVLYKRKDLPVKHLWTMSYKDAPNLLKFEQEGGSGMWPSLLGRTLKTYNDLIKEVVISQTSNSDFFKQDVLLGTVMGQLRMYVKDNSK